MSIRCDRLILGGYTGRDPVAVRQHIEELAKIGVAAPAEAPLFLTCSPPLLTTANEITVLGDRTSGEAEFVLFLGGEEVLVGVGSDHTDRGVEAVSIPHAKHLCPKAVGPEVWRLQEVAGYWDELVLRSWTGVRLYQEDTVGALLSPSELIDSIATRVRALGNTVLFSGTIPLLQGAFAYGPAFTVELFDPRRNRALRAAYRVRSLPLFLSAGAIHD